LPDEIAIACLGPYTPTRSKSPDAEFVRAIGHGWPYFAPHKKTLIQTSKRQKTSLGRPFLFGRSPDGASRDHRTQTKRAPRRRPFRL